MKTNGLWLIAASFLSGAPANATTYDYHGNPYTSFTGGCVWSCTGGMSGSVTFDFDTSSFSGVLSLSPGDTAFLSSGIVPTFYYPGSTQLFSPPLELVSGLSGNFTLTNGNIAAWNLSGGSGLVGCGIGAGCAAASKVANSSTFGDTAGGINPNNLGGYGASNSAGGVWTEEPPVVDAIPEPSTWAMLLIGFAGIGFWSLKKQIGGPFQRVAT